MAKKGDIIENLVTGEKIVFLETSKDTGGKYVRYEYYAKPNSPISPEHFHPKAEESFEVIRGTVSFKIDGKERVSGPGDSEVIKAGVRHTGWNSGSEEIFIKSEIHPAMNFEDYYSTCFYLAKCGKTNKKGMPNIFQLAVLGYDMKNQTFLPGFIWAQKLFFNVVGPIAKLFGYKSTYKK